MLINEITRRSILKGVGATALAAADPTGSLTKMANSLVQTAPASKQDILAELLGHIDMRDLYQIWWGFGQYVTTSDFITPKEENKLASILGQNWYEDLYDRAYSENKSPIAVVQDIIQEPTTYSKVEKILEKHGLDVKNWEQIRDWFFDDVIDKEFFDLYDQYKKAQAKPKTIDTKVEPTQSITHAANQISQDIAAKLGRLKGKVQIAAKRVIQTFLTKGLSNKLSKKQLTDIATGNFDIRKIAPAKVSTLHRLEYKPEVYNQWLEKLETNPTVYDAIVIDDRNNILTGAEQLEALKVLDLTAEVYVVSYDTKAEK